MSAPAISTRDVSRAANGDSRAYARLVQASQNTVASIALAIVRDVAASEDVAQEVFLAAWKNLRRLRNPDSFLPWLRQTTRNRAHDWLRRNQRFAPEAEGLLQDLPAPDPGPDGDRERDERQRLLSEALDRLPEASREVVILYYREGRSIRQVATLLDLGEAAVKQRLSRARKALQENVQARLASVLATSLPGAGFTAGVVAALTPGGAATASVLAGAAKSAGKWTLPKLAGALGSMLASAILGIAAILFGWRREYAITERDRDRRRLRRFLAVGIGTVLLVEVGFLAAAMLESPWLQTGVFGVFFLMLAWMYLRWLPAIVAERDRARGRSEAALRRDLAKRRRIAWLGLTVGGVTGGAGLLYGLFAAGLLP